MKRLTSTICASALAFAVAVSGLAPAMAAPIMAMPSAPDVPRAPIIQTQGPQDFRRGGQRVRPEVRRGQREARRGFHRRGDRYYYNSHRGYRDRRPGYRYHQGWWFPPAAFIAGAIIGGAATRGPGVSSAHVQWCYDRYRSYRSSDNTFQPYQGPRRQCVSPYG